MFYNIVTNMGHQKKPWEDVPIEVLIEYEREKERMREESRPRIYAPSPLPPMFENTEQDEESGEVITIKI